MKSYDLAKYYPIQSIKDDFIVNGDGGITFGFEVLLPQSYMVSPEQLDAIHKGFVDTLKILPSGSVFQQINFFYIKEYEAEIEGKPFTKKNNERFFSSRNVLNHYCDIYFTVKNDVNVITNSQKNSLLQALDYVFKKTTKDLKEEYTLIQSYAERISSSLKNIKGLVFNRIGSNTLKVKNYQYVSQNYDKTYFDVSKEIVPPINFDGNVVQIGNKFTKILSIIGNPTELQTSKIPNNIKNDAFTKKVDPSSSVGLPTSLLYPINVGFLENHVTVLTVTLLDPEKTKSYLSGLKRDAMTMNFLPGLGAEAKLVSNEADEFLEELAKNDFKIAKYAYSVILSSSDKKELELIVNNALSAISTIGFSSYVENVEALNLFFSNIPGNGRVNYRSNLNIHTLGTCMTLLTKESVRKNDPCGYSFVDRNGNPTIVDLWFAPKKKKIITARNRAVFAATGVGKSFLFNTMMCEEYSQGFHIMVIDIGYSYKKLVNLFGGLHFDASNKDLLQFNLFEFEKDQYGNYLIGDNLNEDATDKVIFISTILLKIWKRNKEASNEEITLLKELIIDYYKYVNLSKKFPSLTDFSIYVESNLDKDSYQKNSKYFDYNSLILCLKPYTKGEYKDLFNAQKNLDMINNRLIIFDLEAIKRNEDIMPLVMLVVIELILSKIKKLKQDTPKVLYIDEAFDFISKGSGIDEFIAYLYRTIRKKEGAVCLATQSSKYLDNCSNSVRDSIIANTSIKILLDHSADKGSYKGLKDNWSFSDYEIEVLDTVKKTDYEFLIKMGDHISVYRLIESPENFALYNSDADHNAKIYAMFEKTGNMQACIEEYNRKYLK